MRNALEMITLEDLGIVHVHGVDAVRFLQGQLSNDVARVSAGNSLLAGYHNPQGRTIALLRLVQWDANDILAVVPRELAGVVASRLGKFVLRAKVKVADESAAWRVAGVVDVAASGVAGAGGVAATGGAAGTAATVGVQGAANTGGAAEGSARVLADGSAARELPSLLGAQARGDGAVFVCVGDQPLRWLVISPADVPTPVSSYPVGDRQTWLRLDLAAGQPQVYAATSEEFVAQMLNLDVLNAIAFDKGCYTGQEVIARAHYRGKVKRRMQRFVSRDACRLAPGDSGQLADGRAFKVVLAVQLSDGRSDFLAVAPFVGAGRDEAVAVMALAPAAGAAAATQAVAPAATPVADPAPGAPAPATGAVATAQAMPPAAPSVADPAAPAAPAPVTLVADQVSLPYSLPD
jgi:tRNA-modifying protein YgfZ